MRARVDTDPAAHSWERHTIYLDPATHSLCERHGSGMEKAGACSGGELGAGGADGGWVAFWESVSAAWQDPLLDELEAGVCCCVVSSKSEGSLEQAWPLRARLRARERVPMLCE